MTAPQHVYPLYTLIRHDDPMPRRRLDRGLIDARCDHCFRIGPQQVYDSFAKRRRLGLVPVRSDWYRSWVCQACGYALRQALARHDQSPSTP